MIGEKRDRIQVMDIALPVSKRVDADGSLTGLSSANWAWEFLRRNSAFRRDWAAGRPQLETSRFIQIDQMRQERYLAEWGVLFRGSPDIQLC